MAEDKFCIAGMDIGFNHSLPCILPSGETPVGHENLENQIEKTDDVYLSNLMIL